MSAPNTTRGPVKRNLKAENAAMLATLLAVEKHLSEYVELLGSSAPRSADLLAVVRGTLARVKP